MAREPAAPIKAMARDFPGDAIGPQTSHIMWTKPLQSGGVVRKTTLLFRETHSSRELHTIIDTQIR